MMNILIPNATSKRNIGDLAALESLVHLLRKNFSQDAFITIHSYEPNAHDPTLANRINHTLYDWVAFADTRVFVRIFRLISLIIHYFTNRLNVAILKRGKLQELIDDYKNADLIVFVGGGYLRPKKGVLPSINLLMLLSLFEFAKLFPAKKIVCPMSFGPFAYEWQERIAVKALRGLDVVSVRESPSYDLLNKKYGLDNVFLSCDFALLINGLHRVKHVNKSPILGFTIRRWFDGKKQDDFERSFAEAIIQFVKAFCVQVQPIIQVDGQSRMEFDEIVTEKIAAHLKKDGISVLPTIKVTSVKQGLMGYAELDILLGMRMHSNILAAVVGTPFVAVSYEYKTEGIAEQLGVSQYVIKSEDVDENKLFGLLLSAYKNKDALSTVLSNSIKDIKNNEIPKWDTIFSKAAPMNI